MDSRGIAQVLLSLARLAGAVAVVLTLGAFANGASLLCVAFVGTFFFAVGRCLLLSGGSLAWWG